MADPNNNIYLPEKDRPKQPSKLTRQHRVHERWLRMSDLEIASGRVSAQYPNKSAEPRSK